MHTTENRIYYRGQLGRNRKYWVCMYVYVCLYVCMYVYTYVLCMYICMYVCSLLRLERVCMCMYVCITIFTHEEDLSAFKTLSLCMYCVRVHLNNEWLRYHILHYSCIHAKI